MTQLITPDFFFYYKPLSLKRKIDILFEYYKSNLKYLFINNKVSTFQKTDWKEHKILKNNWLLEDKMCLYADSNSKLHNLYKTKELKELNIFNNITHFAGHYVLEPKTYKKIAIWFYIYKDSKYHYFIKFLQDVYTVERELYKKNTYIYFDTLTGDIKEITDEEYKEFIN